MPGTAAAEMTPLADFENNRALLFGVAYRILSSVDDAEDVVLWPLMEHLLSSFTVTPGPPRG